MRRKRPRKFSKGWIGIRFFLDTFDNLKDHAYIDRHRRLTNPGRLKIVAMTSWVKNTRKTRRLLRAAVREDRAALGPAPKIDFLKFIPPLEGFYVGHVEGIDYVYSPSTGTRIMP